MKAESYDQLLDKARKAAEVFRASAGEFVPKMYEALRKEGVDAADAKDRIEKDLADVWSKDTIRRQIPDEAKNKKISETAKATNKQRTKKTGENPISDKPIVSIAAGGESLIEDMMNPAKPAPVSEPYSAGAKKDREATYTERQTALIQELQEKLNAALKRSKPDAYNDDVTQELIDAQIRIKELEAPFDYTIKIDIGRHRVPAKVHVRPAMKEVTSITILEEDVPAGAF